MRKSLATVSLLLGLFCSGNASAIFDPDASLTATPSVLGPQGGFVSLALRLQVDARPPLTIAGITQTFFDPWIESFFVNIIPGTGELLEPFFVFDPVNITPNSERDTTFITTVNVSHRYDVPGTYTARATGHVTWGEHTRVLGIEGVSLHETVPFEVFTTVTVLVPEPETYAMLLAGLGLLGFAARRRRNLA